LLSGEFQLWITAFEAIAGLVVEGVFIAMLTQLSLANELWMYFKYFY
jgi:hypothetical protein